MYFNKQIEIICSIHNTNKMELAEKLNLSRMRIYKWCGTSTSTSARKSNLDSLCQFAKVTSSFFDKEDVSYFDYYKCSLIYMANNLNAIEQSKAELIYTNIEQLSGKDFTRFINSCDNDALLETVWKIVYAIYTSKY